MLQQEAGSPVTLSVASSSSPSYSNNSSLADIAARVVEEFRAENDSDEFLYVGDLFCGLGGEASEEVVVGKEDIAAAKGGGLQDDEEEQNNNNDGDDEQDNEDQEEFEFAFVPCRDAEEELSLNISTADQIFYNGQIRPVFPIFNREANSSSMCNSSLLLMSSSGDGDDDDEQQKVVSATPPQTIHRLLLLLSEDQETPSSCSSSEADELEGIPEGTYCVWRPKEEGKCKKSNSTGYGWRFKRWRLRDLVNRSNSHGKDTFVFLTPSDSSEDKAAGATQTSKTTAAAKSMPNLTHYTKNRSGDKRRHSYLPYRQHLLGFFANVNGFG